MQLFTYQYSLVSINLLCYVLSHFMLLCMDIVFINGCCMVISLIIIDDSSLYVNIILFTNNSFFHSLSNCHNCMLCNCSTNFQFFGKLLFWAFFFLCMCMFFNALIRKTISLLKNIEFLFLSFICS